MNWNQKIAIVTGASSGIGAATAQALARRGAQLFLVARRQEQLARVCQECLKEGAPRAVASAQDLSVPGEGERVVERCLQELGDLDFLICNAGYGIFGPAGATSPAQMSRIWQVNFQSAYESIHRALPHFSRKRGGHIVLTSSVVGKKGMAFSAAYCATKFAQVGLGEALWGELRGTGIGVSVVCPGFTATEFHEAAERKMGTPGINRALEGQSPAIVAEAIVNAIANRRREIHLSAAGKVLLALDRVSPALATRLMAWVGTRELKPPE
jgi:short-subunit dehydrogenase